MSALPFHERLALDPSEALHAQIRATWVRHNRAVESRSIEEILTTISSTCVYEMMSIGQRWEGYDGAREFYEEMFAAFPDAKVRVEDFVIGPQGVFQQGVLKATSVGWWGAMPPTGRGIEIRLIIYLPWDAEAGCFAGERIYFA